MNCVNQLRPFILSKVSQVFNRRIAADVKKILIQKKTNHWLWSCLYRVFVTWVYKMADAIFTFPNSNIFMCQQFFYNQIDYLLENIDEYLRLRAMGRV